MIMAMIIKAKDPDTGSNRGVTSTNIEGIGGDPDRQGLDVYIIGGLKPLTVKESFDETGLDEDVYEATEAYTRSVFGFTIINNNKEEELTFTIGGVAIPVPPSTSFYDEFDVPDPFEIVVEGDDLDFDAYLKG